MPSVNSQTTHDIVLYLKVTDISNVKITHITDYLQASITWIYEKVCDKEFKLKAETQIFLNEYVKDALRSGRSSKTTSGTINKITSLIKLEWCAQG